MSQALFTVIGGTLVNLAKVNYIENSSVVGADGAPTGRVRVHFENKEQTTLDGSVETVLLKIGGNREDVNGKRPGPPPPTIKPGGGVRGE